MSKAKRRKQKHPILNFIINFFMTAFYIICISALFYPYISDKLNETEQRTEVVEYDEQIQHMEPENKSELLEEANEYNRRLLESPLDINLSDEQMEEYKNTFVLSDDGIMGHISIPNIGVKLLVYHTVEESVLQVGVGHLPGTSLPVGGKGTHCALSGHTGLVTANLFTNLDRLQLGDCFYITVLEDVLTYQVDDISVVLPHEITALTIEPDEDYCTLITCTPYGVNSHRLLVRGHRIPTIWKEDDSLGKVKSIAVYYQPDENRISPTFAEILAMIGTGILAITVLVFLIKAIIKLVKHFSAGKAQGRL